MMDCFHLIIMHTKGGLNPRPSSHGDPKVKPPKDQLIGQWVNFLELHFWLHPTKIDRNSGPFQGRRE